MTTKQELEEAIAIQDTKAPEQYKPLVDRVVTPFLFIEDREMENIVDVRFVVNGTLGKFSLASPIRYSIFIEIKPSIGDDYPLVLRQINNQRDRLKRHVVQIGRHIGAVGYDLAYCHFVLIYDRFTATGVTEEQMRQMFLAANISPIKFSEV